MHAAAGVSYNDGTLTGSVMDVRTAPSVAVLATVAALAMLFSIPGYCQDAATPDQALTRADAAWDGGDMAAARRMYRLFLDSRPTGPAAERAAFRYAEATLRDGTLDEGVRLNGAVEAFELAISAWPQSKQTPAAYLSLARTYIGLGLVQDAIIRLREARERLQNPENGEELLLLLADSYYRIEDFAQSVIHFSTFLDQFPGARAANEVRLKLADSYHRIRDYARARSRFEEALAADRAALVPWPVLRFQFAETLMFTGDLDAADREFTALDSKAADVDLLGHIRFRRADIHRLRAEAAIIDATKGKEQREAMQRYAEIWREGANPRLAESAAVRLVELADEAHIDIVREFKLPTADALLNTIFERNLDPFVRSLVLTRLARHNRQAGNVIPALEYYKRLATEFHGVALADEVSSEFHRYLRDLLDAAWKAEDFGAFLDVYLGYGLALELSLPERLRLAVAYTRMQLYDKAEAEFADLLKFGITSEQRRAIALERMEINFRRRNYIAALREAGSVLALEPTPSERERALLLRQEIHFADRDLSKLQAWYLEGSLSDFNTPLLRSSVLFKLGTLHFLKATYGEAEAYLEQFFNEFGEGAEGDRRLYALIGQATITMADIYYQQGRYPEALQLYERTLFLSPPGEDISWPLLQSGLCRRQMRQPRLATAILEEFVRRYPKHYLRAEADKVLGEIRAAANGR